MGLANILRRLNIFRRLKFKKKQKKYEKDSEKEYLIKAAMLMKFHQLTKWPKSHNAADAKIINICVVGENPFSAKARGLFTAGSTAERQYKFLKGDVYKKRFCHIVFIGDCNQKKLDSVLESLKSVPTLTVSDKEGFANMGGNIQFVVAAKNDKDQKIKLILNERAALEKGFTFDSEMKSRNVSTVIHKSH